MRIFWAGFGGEEEDEEEEEEEGNVRIVDLDFMFYFRVGEGGVKMLRKMVVIGRVSEWSG